MLAFASLIILALGRRLSLRQEALAGESREGVPAIDPRRLALDVVRFTFVIEAAGAILLYILWIPKLGFRGAIWPAVFHSVSAFCNAGFSTFSDSLIGFQEAPLSLGVIMALIIAGGLGFLTMEEGVVWLHSLRTGKRFRISMQTSLILLTSGVLILSGWILFAILEWNATLRDLPVPDKLANALFMSVTSRTAGFNSVDYAKASDSANFLTILLMSIGGSPGSTAGGIKTTTFALIGLLAWSRLRGYEITNFMSRSIREETTDRAVGLFVIAFGLITAGLFLLTAAEHHRVEDGRFLMRMFEVASAFNTVGLSMGLTYELTGIGKWIIIVLMYVGRIGPLTFAAALTIRRSGQIGFRYAYEDVIVG
jgi:trk system potassium uptake protein TrkH